jgi:hypothetical protein
MSGFGKHLTAGAVALGLMVVVAANSRAQAPSDTNFWWTGLAGDGIWEDAGNWVLTNNIATNIYPSVSFMGAVFTNTGTYSVSINNGDNIVISNATFDCTTGGTATVTLTLNGSAALNESGVSGGIDGFTVAEGSNTTVTVYLAAGAGPTSPGMDDAANLDVGHDGNGTLIITNGYVLTANVVVLGTGVGRGTLIISGPNTYWDAYQFAIGNTNASYGNTMIVSNSASLTDSSTFRVGSSSGTASSNNTLIVTDGAIVTITGGSPFTVGNRATMTGTLANNNAIIVGNGGVIDIPNHTIIVGDAATLESGITCSSCPASGTYASNNVFQVQAGGTVSNATQIAITGSNTFQLYGGYFGGGTFPASSDYYLGNITNFGVFEGWGVLAGSLNNGSNTYDNSLGFIAVSNQVGQLVVSNSFTAASNTVVQIALGTSYNPIAVGLGQADPPGSALVTNNNLVLYATINFTNSGGFGLGTYTLFTYPPSLVVTQPANGCLINSNHFNVAPVIGTVPNPAYTYTISTNTPGEVNLIVTCPSCPPPPPFAITSVTRTNAGLGNGNNDILLQFNTTGTVDRVWAGPGTANGSFATNTMTVLTSITVNSATTNYVDPAGATNRPARYYHISSP